MKESRSCRNHTVLLLVALAIVGVAIAAAVSADELLPFPDIQQISPNSPKIQQMDSREPYYARFRIQVTELTFEELCELERQVTARCEKTKDVQQRDYYLVLLKIIFEEKQLRLQKQRR